VVVSVNVDDVDNDDSFRRVVVGCGGCGGSLLLLLFFFFLLSSAAPFMLGLHIIDCCRCFGSSFQLY
jgi:hypothetical protein